METNIYQSDLAIHPGEFLEETIEELGMSQAELANRLGRPVQAINEIIKGKKSITSTTALELEDVLGVPSHIWIGLESEYQIVLARQEELKQMEEESTLLKNFPYADLVKLGFVKATRKAVERVDELKRFFSVAKLAQISHVKAYQPAFRVSNHGKISHESIATWIQAARIKAKEIETEIFDKKKLKESLAELKSLMNLDDINESINELQKVLNGCGVVLVLLPHFKNTKVNGATFWLDSDKAVIAMTPRGGFSDIFWFSFFHEVGHILRHPKREVFLEDGCDDPKLKKQEDEADRFASDLLINNKDFEQFIASGDFSQKSVITFAEEQGVKTSIVVGRLMHHEVIKFNDYKLSPLRDRYKWK
ncbi:MAG: HigA family addiction module antitoxin [Sulfurovum sp.]|jgi:HTH-type transcriptional regulator/antitoxin HigA|nr:HigA family addiction module antitoxin [Sulfurovum sp.]MDD3499031.1 HigA family addiction module antitoxin [Sulfurovum sp.]